MQINLSEFTDIKVESINELLYLNLAGIMTGVIPKKTITHALQKAFSISSEKIEIFNIRGNLVFQLEIEPQMNKSSIIEIISTIISQSFSANFINKITGRKIFYITKESRIPLIGSLYFGIIDRGTNLLQIRPITGCLLNCPFCSVDEGTFSKTRITDYIVSKDYLLEETKKLIDFKGDSTIEIHIDGQSEPTLYPYLPELITEFSKDSRIAVISLQTNGVPLTEQYLHKLEKAGLTRINLSLNSLNPKTAKYLAGTSKYNIEDIKHLVQLIKNSSIQLLISPIWIPGINDQDIPEIISYTLNHNIKSQYPILGIQNFLKYRFGRKIPGVKIMNMHKFQQKLQEWSTQFHLESLSLTPNDFGIHPAKSPPKPFRRGEKVDVKIVLPGRMASKNPSAREMLGVAKNRIIQVSNSTANVNEWIRVQITHTKDNIFYARQISHQKY
ncbi:MAG: radical SAM protein [Candidatus Helarchaeota archaeon]